MAEITNINKGKGTAQQIVQDALVVFRQYMDIPYISEGPDEEMKTLFEAFGGKPGQGQVKTPKKLTVEQAIAFLDFSGFPLADENAKFSIADALRIEAPEMFEEKSFKDYQKKFGKTMEMQEKSASASKNITTAKTPKAANQPVAKIDYKAKIADGSITVREAFEAVLAKNLSKSKKDTIGPLFKALPDEGIDLDAPYFEVYNTRKFAEAMDYTTNNSGVHRYKEFGSFETELDGLIGNTKRYIRLSDSNKAKGIASKEFSLTGTQLRNADPMRATVPSEALDKIYNDALFPVGSSEIDTKRGLDKPTLIDPEARDYLLYEKYTGQRAQSNIGVDGLKISDFNFFTDENNNIVVEVASKKVGNKTRPEVTYTGEFAEFLRNKVERAKGNLPPDADLSKVNLFQTTPNAVTKLWDAAIRPALEKDWKNALPAKKGGSHSTVRKILARQLVAEFKFPRDAVKAWMGHAGAGVDAAGDILDDNYIGTVPDERIGGMTNALVQTDAFNTKANNVNTMFVNRGAGYSQEVLFETPTKKPMGNNPDVNFAGFKGLGRDFTTGELEEISSLASSRAVETEIATESRRQYLSKLQSERRTAAPNLKTQPLLDPAGKAPLSEATVEKLKSAGIWDRFSDKLGTIVAGAATSLGVYSFITEPEAAVRDIALDAAGQALKFGRVASAPSMIMTPSEIGSSELRPEDRPPQDPAGPYAGQDFIPAPEVEQGTPRTDMARIATQDSGFIPEPSRVPEAAPARNEGFLSR